MARTGRGSAPSPDDPPELMTWQDREDLQAQIDAARVEMRRLDAMMLDVVFYSVLGSAVATLIVLVILSLVT